MTKVERLIRLVEAKVAEVNRSKVYVGRIEDGKWQSESLLDRYTDLVMVVEAPEEGEPAPVIGDYEFIGGNGNRLVYVKQSIISRWLEVANGDSHWAAAAVLRPGKLAQQDVTFNWKDYDASEEDEGLLAVLHEEDWKRVVKAFDLDGAKLMQVTVFDLKGVVSAKGTIRLALPGEKPKVFPNSWKKFGTLRTKFMAVLTTDAHYNPRASVNLQELQYYAEQPAEWVFEALNEEVERILAFRTSPWLTTGYLTALGFSPAWNITLAALKEHLTGELKKLLRRIKLSSRYGLRAKSTSSHLLKDGELMLPAYAREHVKVGDFVTVSRNPALPSQGWGQYRVAGFVDGNVVVFAHGDKQWSGLLGGDHDGDDAVVFFASPVEGYEPPKDALDLQAIKPNGRKMGSNSVEERIARWRNERTVNIGQFDLAARRLLAFNKLDAEGRKLFTIAIQTAISLKKRVAKLEEQPWYPLVEELLKESKRVAGITWVDFIREGEQPIGAPEWVTRIYKTVQEAIKRVEKLEPRLWLTEAKVKEFAGNATVPASCEWVVKYREHLLKAKTIALLNDDGDTVARINRELKEFVHVGVPSWLTEIDEADWMEFSRWAIGNTHSSEWVFWCHPEVLEELYQTFSKRVMVAITAGNHTLSVGDVFEVEEEEAINREFEIDGQTYHLLDDTGYIKAGTRYQVLRIRKRVVEFAEV